MKTHNSSFIILLPKYMSQNFAFSITPQYMYLGWVLLYVLADHICINASWINLFINDMTNLSISITHSTKLFWPFPHPQFRFTTSTVTTLNSAPLLYDSCTISTNIQTHLKNSQATKFCSSYPQSCPGVHYWEVLLRFHFSGAIFLHFHDRGNYSHPSQ